MAEEWSVEELEEWLDIPYNQPQKTDDSFDRMFRNNIRNILNKKKDELKINKKLMPLGKVWNPKEKAWFFHTINVTGEDNFVRLN